MGGWADGWEEKACHGSITENVRCILDIVSCKMWIPSRDIGWG